MVRELIYFDLHLGPESDRFRDLFNEVREGMRELGVVVGRRWVPMTGPLRTVIMEREFESMAAYEADDERFHSSKAFMAKWRELEAASKAIRVEVWGGGN